MTCQNQQNECAPSKDSDQPGHPPSFEQSSLCAQWVAKDPSFLHADSKDSDQAGRMPRQITSLGAHSLCWFCHVVAHLFSNSWMYETGSNYKWAPSSEFVSSSIPSWQILTAHAQPFRGARDLAFCLKVPLDSLLVWASSEGSGETARMRRLAWTFAAGIGDKYQIRSTRSK